MSVWALLPVKDFELAKTRLSTCLTSNQRADLARAMFLDTLNALAKSAQIDRIAVVTNHSSAQDEANKIGALAIDEPGMGLNPALEAGRRRLLSAGATAIVVFPSDIPAIRPADADEIIRAGCENGTAVIVPDHLRQGTNALLLHSQMQLRYAFGPNSFAEHGLEAQLNNIPMRTLSVRHVEHDCDRPEDIKRMAATPQGKCTTEVLRKLETIRVGAMGLVQ